MTQTKVLEVSVRIAARPETIFPFLVDPKLAVRWMGTSAKLDPRPGGVYDVNVTGRDIARGEFVEVVPNSRVVFTWGWDNEDTQVPPGSTTVEITLVPRGDATIVTLRHLGLPDDHHPQHTEGWQHYLKRLSQVSEGRDPGTDPMTNPPA